MDFKQFEYVAAVSEEKSISRAARKLFISQPSLSQYINRVEADLGVTLFDRSTTPLILTHEGTIYLETAKKILESIKEMKDTFENIADLKIGEIAIGLTCSKANNPLPAILPVFKEKYPGIEFSLVEASSAKLELLLLKGSVDLCLMNLPLSNPNIAYEKISSEKILLAAPPDFKYKQNTENESMITLNITDIADENFILLHSDQRIRQISNKIFEAYKIKPNILLETRNIESAVRLTAAGMGFSFIPEDYALTSGIVNVPQYFLIGDPPLTWDLIVAYKDGAYLSKAAKAFIDVTKQVASDICHNQK